MERIASDEVFETWQSRLNTIGQQVEVDGIVGQAQAVDTSGALLITLADGSIKRVLAGDVSLVPPQNEG
jgi:biotin-(acetyl-CoA carboxylase) ligase